MDTAQLLEAVEVIRQLKGLSDSTQNEWLPVAAAIGGAFIGGVSSIIPAYISESRRRRHERVCVTNALVAEIKGIVSIVKHRDYINTITETADQLAANPLDLVELRVVIPAHYSRVYQASVHQLGVLDPQFAAKVIEFHQLVDAAVQDISPTGLIATEGGDAKAFSELARIVTLANSLGNEIVKVWGPRGDA